MKPSTVPRFNSGPAMVTPSSRPGHRHGGFGGGKLPKVFFLLFFLAGWMIGSYGEYWQFSHLSFFFGFVLKAHLFG